jgi:hypothetical protein
MRCPLIDAEAVAGYLAQLIEIDIDTLARIETLGAFAYV